MKIEDFEFHVDLHPTWFSFPSSHAPTYTVSCVSNIQHLFCVYDTPSLTERVPVIGTRTCLAFLACGVDFWLYDGLRYNHTLRLLITPPPTTTTPPLAFCRITTTTRSTWCRRLNKYDSSTADAVWSRKALHLTFHSPLRKYLAKTFTTFVLRCRCTIFIPRLINTEASSCMMEPVFPPKISHFMFSLKCLNLGGNHHNQNKDVACWSPRQQVTTTGTGDGGITFCTATVGLHITMRSYQLGRHVPYSFF